MTDQADTTTFMSHPKQSLIKIHSRGSINSSRALCADDWVFVKDKEEILATLDQNGCLDGVPFMPEMLEFCGRRMQVYKRAHKTCDYVTDTGMRALSNAAHLHGARCSGTSHGGCDARCLLYWKKAWLRPTPENIESAKAFAAEDELGPTALPENICESTLHAVCSNGKSGADLRYSCQATLVPKFTTKLPWWNVRQYMWDLESRNVATFGEMLPSMIFRVYDNLINLGIGLGRPLRWVYDRFQAMRGGRPYPTIVGTIKQGDVTPSLVLGLKVGERVRVKSHSEILSTLDTTGRNRGMIFSAEMIPYCGNEYQVLGTVRRLVDEKTGKLIELKTACVILDGVICRARYLKDLLFCPRATFPYWREIWLDRVDD